MYDAKNTELNEAEREHTNLFNSVGTGFTI